MRIRKTSAPHAPAGRMRLQRFLSDAGIASRRQAEELILEGRVLVNDRIVDSLPAFVEPRKDRVIVDGQLVRVQPPTYFLVHKPKGFVCTNADPDGRPRITELVPPDSPRVFPVGRLEADSSGLMILTNDGELAQQISHPSSELAKVYLVEVKDQVDPQLPERMKKGVYFAEGRARASEVEILHASRNGSVLRLTLREGRNVQIPRLLARLGHRVRKLKRIQIGPLTIKGLPVGGARHLSDFELGQLRRELSTPPQKRREYLDSQKRLAARDRAAAAEQQSLESTVPPSAGSPRRPRPTEQRGIPSRTQRRGKPAAKPAVKPAARATPPRETPRRRIID